jgi:hypothetical protein
MPHDAEAFGNQFPAYRVNPMAETLRALEALALDPSHASTRSVLFLAVIDSCRYLHKPA